MSWVDNEAAHAMNFSSDKLYLNSDRGKHLVSGSQLELGTPVSPNNGKCHSSMFKAGQSLQAEIVSGYLFATPTRRDKRASSVSYPHVQRLLSYHDS